MAGARRGGPPARSYVGPLVSPCGEFLSPNRATCLWSCATGGEGGLEHARPMHERVYDVGGVGGLGREQAESSFLCPQLSRNLPSNNSYLLQIFPLTNPPPLGVMS